MTWLKPTTKTDHETALARPFGELNRLFNHFFGDLGFDATGATVPETWFPPMDVQETKDAWLLTFDMPGVDPKGVQITTDQDELTIRGEIASDQQQGTTAHRRERRTGTFVRTLTLPSNVNVERIAANSKNGVLYVTLPKTEESKPRTIKVEVA